MRTLLHTTTLLLAGLLIAGCASKAVNENEPSPRNSGDPVNAGVSDEPAYITVDHILIGVTHERLKHVKRTAQEARRLAYELKMRLDSGEDWHALKDEFSDDRDPRRGVGGPYAMANTGQTPRSRQETPRGKMVSAFGDVGFALKVGEVGVADYDPQASKYGYHIIKRVK